MPLLYIIVRVEVDPTIEEPHEIAQYALDARCDDPVIEFVGAEWEGNEDMLVNSTSGRRVTVLNE